MDTLDKLIERVTDELGKGTKLKDLELILASYTGDDWKEYCKFCNQNYKRNIVSRTGLLDVMVICWNNKQESGIHDHPEGGCLLRVMQGTLTEEVYLLEDEQPKKTKVNHVKVDDISYKIGASGLHNIINPEDSKSVTLHLYSPGSYTPNFYDP